jgi:hypothetical protein
VASWTSAPSPAAERGIVHRGGSGDLFDLVRSEVGPNLRPFAPHLQEVPGGWSARLGWHDQAHFTNGFRRMLGTTPARYAAAARR